MRVLRASWVLLTNGIAVYLLYAGTRQVALLNHLLEQDTKNRDIWSAFGLRAAVPIIGILLELAGSRFARCVNVGYFFVVGVVFSCVGIFTWPDHHGLVYLALGLLALGVGISNYFWFRERRNLNSVRS
jgi:predicted membrane channel-forming protein YqfA (hemolysin III family)